jgi:5-methylcytosine-specific restriction endonuclease McrA
MPTNRHGYANEYFRRERALLVALLGGRCAHCGTTDELQFHHIKPLNGNRPKGQLNRLTEWKRNVGNLQLLCPLCHLDAHNGVRKWWKYQRRKEMRRIAPHGPASLLQRPIVKMRDLAFPYSLDGRPTQQHARITVWPTSPKTPVPGF